MIRFIKSLQFIFKPRYWSKLYPYCPLYDKKINELLDAGVKFTNIDCYTADLGSLKTIWIGSPASVYGAQPLRNEYQPSRLTMKRMKRVLAESLLTTTKEGK